MSKSDDLRAIREARFASSSTRPTLRLVPSDGIEPADGDVPQVQATTSRPARARLEPAVAGAVAAQAAQVGRCGHRAISGRTCTREAGHAAKSHRYV